MNIASPSKLFLSLINGLHSLTGCSDGYTEFTDSSGRPVPAARISGSADGDFNASGEMVNASSTADVAAQGTIVEGPAVITPPKEGVATGNETNQDRIDTALMGACLDKLKVQNNFASFKVVNIEGTNENNRILYEDPANSEPSLTLLRIVLKNVNSSSIKILNPKSTYCIDMQVKNMNQFKFQVACESKAGFVRLTNKNANKMSTDVIGIQCD